MEILNEIREAYKLNKVKNRSPVISPLKSNSSTLYQHNSNHSISQCPNVNQHNEPETPIAATVACINKDNMTFVTVSRFLELEEKVKQMANDLQGMKNEVRNPAPERNLESSVNSIPPAPPKSSTKSHEKIPSQANLFIVGDAHVRNMKETIKKKLPSNWSIEESYDIKANLSFVSKKCIQQIDKCDHLILMAGSNDICSSAKRDMLTSIKKVIDKYNENSPNIHHLVIENYGYAYYNKVWENVHIACSLEYAIDLYENEKEDSTRIAVDISSEIINDKFEKVSSPYGVILQQKSELLDYKEKLYE
ncbi:hypothetical protein M8J75_013185 [Diaphorina citri]|nr:hypothetical protein M8J75_013185 [Diaphorina citri]